MKMSKIQKMDQASRRRKNVKSKTDERSAYRVGCGGRRRFFVDERMGTDVCTVCKEERMSSGEMTETCA
jgi:hypothetical protein